jgi:DNA-binding NtrC family response regulator
VPGPLLLDQLPSKDSGQQDEHEACHRDPPRATGRAVDVRHRSSRGARSCGRQLLDRLLVNLIQNAVEANGQDLERCGGNQKEAAALLGISRRTLITRLDQYDLPRPRRRS